MPPRTSSTRTERQIAECRQQLQRAFLANDHGETQFWMDSLRRLETATFTTLYWDERWLLYLWLENYTPVFQEVLRYNDIEADEAYRIRPPKDSLFEVIDQKLYDERFALFDHLNRAWLSAEERAFGALLINYLLRLNVTEEEQEAFDAQLDAFLKKYPNSRFKKFILARMYHAPKPADWGLGFDVLVASGNWTDALSRSLNAPVGVEFCGFFSKKRWMGGVRLSVGGAKLSRTVVHRGFDWLEGDPYTFLQGELEAGYALYRKGRLQIGPIIAGGRSGITPPTDEEGNYPEYYPDVFRFSGWHYTAAVQADVAFNRVQHISKSSYHGLRLRLGHRWLSLDAGNPSMRGSQFFVSIGYVIFGRHALNPAAANQDPLSLR
ncbi:MAG: hypothetical protein RMJ33_08885 [Saprospiraceae bacterium]|nr:hypothetical protein [Saprospiraceae bacterium]MDW8229938.1 hypothetical protein [Saprospiraceae bacterium]